MAVALALFAWALGAASWTVLRLVSAGPEALLEMRLPAMLASAALATALTWLTAGVAAFMLGRRRAAWRKI
jgi:hypothetical protein